MMTSTSHPEQQERNWLDLPSDVTANILSRIGMVDILENVEKVCTAWFDICKDPSMWRVINMNDFDTSAEKLPLLSKRAVDRSQGQLVEITILYPDMCDYDTILLYVADRSSQLRRLEMVGSHLNRSLSDSLMKFPLLEELNLYSVGITKEEIETVGRHCPLLRTLKVNEKAFGLWPFVLADKLAIAIGQNLHGLRHLELTGNSMTNSGLQVILDNCLHLETLDLRGSLYINLKGELGKKCSKRIKYLKLPNDSLEGCPYINHTNSKVSCEDYDEDSYMDYDSYEDYDDLFDHSDQYYY